MIKLSDKHVIAGFSLSGEVVKNLRDKSFVVIGAENRVVKDLRDPKKLKEKAVLTIEIAGQQMEWYANKRSLKYIASKQGSILIEDLIGFKGEFITVQQVVGDQGIKEVIYVKGSIQV